MEVGLEPLQQQAALALQLVSVLLHFPLPKGMAVALEVLQQWGGSVLAVCRKNVQTIERFGAAELSET